MKSRTVSPIRRREQNKKRKKKRNSLGDTQPMTPVNSRSTRENLSDTRPMRPISVRTGYQQYRKSVEQRRQMVQSGNIPYARPPVQKRKAQKHPSQGATAGLVRVLRKMKKKTETKEQYFDYDLLLVIVFLMCFGLVMLYSTSSYEAQVDFGNDMYYFFKQALVAVVGFVVMYWVSGIDYHYYGAFALEIYVVSFILMILVQTPLGVTVNGARRWIRLPGNMTLQPAEITKVAVILFISYELCRLGKKAYRLKTMGRVFAWGALAAVGVRYLTDNLSTAVIVLAITCVLIFLVHPKTKPFLVFAAGVAAAAACMIAVLAVTAVNSDNFRLQRIISWLNPEATADDGSFQVMQGLYAIGSGGFFGKGLGNSVQKLGIIPEAQNDMILVVICEELGVFGAVIILVLFGILLYRLMFIAKNAPDLFGSLIASGIFAHIALQVILNIAVVTGLLPTTGITLPFISYGGTAVLILLAEMGIALGISRRIRLEGSSG